MTEPKEYDERLMWLLKKAGEEWGAMGVALAAASLTDRQALIVRLQDEIGGVPKPPVKAQPGPENPYGKHAAGTANPYLGITTSTSGNPATDDPAVEPNGITVEVLEKLPAATLSAGTKVLRAAMKYAGRPYAWGATGPDAFDCSGLTQRAYKEALGIDIGRTTYDQIKHGREVPFNEAQDGDLIFSNFSAPGTPEHVSINIAGPDEVFEAGNPVGTYKWGNRGDVVVKRYV